MKKVLIFPFLVLFIACRNKKAELVDLQKKYVDSTSYYKRVADQNMSLRDTDRTLSAKEIVGKDMQDRLKQVQCEHIVDSLEWELKKY